MKRDSNTGVSCGYCEIFKSCFFIEHFWWLVLTVLPYAVKLAGVSVLLFHTSACFNFDQKHTQNVAQIILYYHVARQSLACLNRLITCFRFQNMFWKSIIVAFDFDEKLTQNVAQITM